MFVFAGGVRGVVWCECDGGDGCGGSSKEALTLLLHLLLLHLAASAAATSAAAASVCRMALGSDANVHELLLSLVERLGHEQEVGWLDALIQEMVGVLDQLLGSPTVKGGEREGGRVWCAWGGGEEPDGVCVCVWAGAGVRGGRPEGVCVYLGGGRARGGHSDSLGAASCRGKVVV